MWKIITSFKLRSPLKIVLKKKKKKTSPTVSGTVNFGSPNLTKPKIEYIYIYIQQMLQHFHSNFIFSHGKSQYDILLFILKKCYLHNIFTKKL